MCKIVRLCRADSVRKSYSCWLTIEIQWGCSRHGTTVRNFCSFPPSYWMNLQLLNIHLSMKLYHHCFCLMHQLACFLACVTVIFPSIIFHISELWSWYLNHKFLTKLKCCQKDICFYIKVLFGGRLDRLTAHLVDAPAVEKGAKIRKPTKQVNKKKWVTFFPLCIMSDGSCFVDGEMSWIEHFELWRGSGENIFSWWVRLLKGKRLTLYNPPYYIIWEGKTDVVFNTNLVVRSWKKKKQMNINEMMTSLLIKLYKKNTSAWLHLQPSTQP